MIGTEAAAKSAPDGYTFLLTPAATLAVLPTQRKTPYDPFKSFVTIGRLADVQCGFVINPAAGPQTFKDMVAFAKANPGKLAYGSSGPGTATHLRLEMLKLKAGIDILHVPYRGGAETLTDVLANNVNMMNEPVSLPHAKAGKLILLNINHPQRSPDFPDVPTLTELGLPGADVPLWFALYGPAGLPKEIVEKLNAKIVEIAKTDEIKTRLRGVGAIVPIQTPEQVAQFLEEDTKTNAELIKAANIKLE
jgi:tripartite-type tricarboxylate transporter receptor subunit TctC